MALKDLTNQELVEFKGNKRGIVIIVKKQESLDVIKQNIIDKIEKSVGFFAGAKIHSINSEYLSDIDIMRIKEAITSKFDVEFIEDECIKVEEKRVSFNTRYITGLRSGENIEFDGDVVVMVDMKPGSQITSNANVVVMGNVGIGARIVASGNVIVMGCVNGFIHAGSNGNENAYVVANTLSPKVLRIANNMAEAPEEDNEEMTNESNPEIAFINEKRIVIESYLPNSLK